MDLTGGCIKGSEHYCEYVYIHCMFYYDIIKLFTKALLGLIDFLIFLLDVQFLFYLKIKYICFENTNEKCNSKPFNFKFVISCIDLALELQQK